LDAGVDISVAVATPNGLITPIVTGMLGLGLELGLWLALE
jgi:pyruvate/2-oxoglutarate dehydrogenase complex dihydrolipoamide acyltransferase (E2) component